MKLLPPNVTENMISLYQRGQALNERAANMWLAAGELMDEQIIQVERGELEVVDWKRLHEISEAAARVYRVGQRMIARYHGNLYREEMGWIDTHVMPLETAADKMDRQQQSHPGVS